MKQSLTSLAVASALFLAGCQVTQTSNNKSTAYETVPPAVMASSEATGTESITLEQAMAHPDWLGRKPEGAFWSADSQTVLFKQKQVGSKLRDTFSYGEKGLEQIALSNQHQIGADDAVYSRDGKQQAYTFSGNIFVKDITTNQVTQLTRSSQKAEQLQFLTNGQLAYVADNTFYAIDLRSGLTTELAKLITANAPQGVTEPQSYLAKEQHKLIGYVALQHKNAKDAQSRKEALIAQNDTLDENLFYLGKDQRIVETSLSPAGDKLIVAVTKDVPERSAQDIMPNYVTQDGNIDPVKARSRVADNKPIEHTLIFIDLNTKEQHALSYQGLPGFDDDALAEVKSENARAQGKTYTSKKSPRHIALILDWAWDQSAIQWNAQGSEVAVMVEAWDNKDRWIATVDFTNNKLVSQHRLHDKAWVNYTHNDFGWLNHEDTLYYLSEESGYSHLYTKPLKGKATQLTSGKYEVSELTLTKDDSAIYFKANIKHPGVYEIYRVNVQSGEQETLTNLNGMTDYVLSPDESKLLLTHSKIAMPPELFIADAKPGSTAKQITHTVSEAFLSKKLITPKVVAVPSSHTDQPIYAKVYYPADYQEGEQGKTRKAVIFNHGAGYLQNSHMGWSVYFREFMFHSLLASEGYVVMDMDYRASKGYGRDWRTAIYRHMGKPEIEDLADGVNWMVENVNVDRGAVGTYGGSYGGFMTFMALFTQPELFQAGAALRPVTDWAYYNDTYTSNILNRPADDPIAYRRSSPIYFAEGLNKPMLINAPMIDDNVFFQDVVRLVQRLIELEKENYETAIYPVEPHGFVQPSSWLDQYRRIYKLFKENL
ncbi:prolyl oligopeptidase family serine peptidase [Pseudoalteromonas viridis]|uniref:Prolyl oligopeptidase family serine peptidase n=1 Tax=Pseudoalteromonas viridis TaxID=339617 RepID=A0ABX7V819_9GAMM|nr:prolyl oligopeptidase family serine peptidase [Pseudoalteromonas viridis]QTL34818.1 prolyl oligopeptidase family serine peptidase [Pseudoalteromonas viridis]